MGVQGIRCPGWESICISRGEAGSEKGSNKARRVVKTDKLMMKMHRIKQSTTVVFHNLDHTSVS